MAATAISSTNVLTDKRTDTFNSLLALRQEGGEHLPPVNHILPDIQGYLDASRFGTLGYTGRVIEQRFGRAHLNKHRWQSL